MDAIEATDPQKTALLRHLFGDLEETMQTLAPEGWERSPWYGMFHPDARRHYLEGLDDYEFWMEISKRMGEVNNEMPPTPEEYEDEPEKECFPMDELRTLVGACVYKILEQEGSVAGADGSVFDFSPKGECAAFIEEFTKQFYPSEREDFWYDHFYYAAPTFLSRADATPVYELLFRRLTAQGCDWEFYRSYDFFDEMMEDWKYERRHEFDEPQDMEHYDPSKGILQEFAAEEAVGRLERLQQVFKSMWEEELEKLEAEPPPVVKAYRNVYGRLPDGFPPNIRG